MTQLSGSIDLFFIVKFGFVSLFFIIGCVYRLSRKIRIAAASTKYNPMFRTSKSMGNAQKTSLAVLRRSPLNCPFYHSTILPICTHSGDADFAGQPVDWSGSLWFDQVWFFSLVWYILVFLY